MHNFLLSLNHDLRRGRKCLLMSLRTSMYRAAAISSSLDCHSDTSKLELKSTTISSVSPWSRYLMAATESSMVEASYGAK